MPTVEVHERLAAPIEDVWALISDVSSYPRLMEPVIAVDILEDNGASLLTSWEVMLKGSILRWTEREWRDPAAYHIAYQQVDGDLESFDGFWRLRELRPDATDAALIVQFEIGVPMLRDMLNPVAERAIRQNSQTMLLSLAPRMDDELSA